MRSLSRPVWSGLCALLAVIVPLLALPTHAQQFHTLRPAPRTRRVTGRVLGHAAPGVSRNLLTANVYQFLAEAKCEIWEYTPDGALLSKLPIPGNWVQLGDYLNDIVVDRHGVIHVLVNGAAGAAVLRSYDPATQTWTERGCGGWSLPSGPYFGDVAVWGDYVYGTDYSNSGDDPAGIIRVNLADGTAQRFHPELEPGGITVGLDGLLYTIGDNLEGWVTALDPETMEVLRTVRLPLSYNYNLVVDEQGNIYTGVVSDAVYKFSPSGQQLGRLQLPSPPGPLIQRPFDLDWAADGTLLASSTGGLVYSLDRNLGVISSFKATTGFNPCCVTAAAPDRLSPWGLSATFVGGSVRLDWSDTLAETAFRIERKAGNGAWQPLASVDANVTSYTDPSVSGGGTFSYRVLAVFTAGRSAPSNEAIETVPAPPVSPGNLAATALSSSSIRLTWVDRSADETAFDLQRRTGSGEFVGVGSVGPNVTEFVDSGLSAGTAYTYRALARNDGGASPFSNEATATTGILPPGPPTGLSAKAAVLGHIVLTWTDGSSNEDAFTIERAVGTGSFDPLGAVGAGVTQYDDGTVAENTTYVYRVRAQNAGGASTYAISAPVTSLTRPPASPTDLRITASSAEQISLAWTDQSTTEDSFVVERAIGTGDFIATGIVGANITTFVDKNLLPDTTFTYRVRAALGANLSAPSNTASVTTPVLPPLAPSNLAAQAAGAGAIDLAWMDRSNNETGFIVERSPDGTSFAQLGTTGANVALFHDSGLSAGTQYYYRVRSTNAGGTSAPTNVAQATTLPAPPATPAGLRVIGTSASSINLAWDAASGATGYSLERRNPGGEFAAVANPAGTSYSDTGLQPNTTYAFRLRATNAGGPSPYSTEVSATTGSNLPTPPGMPANFAAEVLSASSVRLTWSTPAGPVSSYRLERADGGSAFAPVGTPGAAETSYTDAGLQPNTAYQYRLSAGNAGGQSPYAGPVSATTLPNPPAAPGGLAVTGLTASAITLRWNASAGAEQYVLERKTGTGNFGVMASLSAATTLYTDRAATPGVAYAYRVKAANTGGESGYSSTVAATIPAGGKLKLSLRSVNFGTVARGRSGKKSLKLTNAGKGPLVVTVGAVAAPFGVLSGTGTMTLAPGKSVTVTLQFIPTAAAPASANLAITSTDPAAQAVSVGLTGRSR